MIGTESARNTFLIVQTHCTFYIRSFVIFHLGQAKRLVGVRGLILVSLPLNGKQTVKEISRLCSRTNPRRLEFGMAYFSNDHISSQSSSIGCRGQTLFQANFSNALWITHVRRFSLIRENWKTIPEADKTNQSCKMRKTHLKQSAWPQQVMHSLPKIWQELMKDGKEADEKNHFSCDSIFLECWTERNLSGR